MNELWLRLKQRKLVQWAIAWVAFAFALLQGIDIVAQRFNWPGAVERYLILALALAFFVVLVLAWYHGERGAQRIGGTELVIIALLLAIGGGLIWRFGSTTVSRSPDVAKRNPRAISNIAPDSAADAAASELHEATGAQAIPAKSIAVLPFENLSDDKQNEYFVAGMQDLILTKLADIGGLKVIARTSTAMYASHPQNLTEIGQQLGVATILEGSVQKAGNQVLINVQLIDTRTDSHIWAQSYQRTLDNVFGVEGDVAEKIATALNTRLSGAEAASLAAVPTHNQAAMDAFLRAEYQANKGLTDYDTANFRAAIPLYRQAIEQDPGFALAYARVSYAESVLAWFGGGGMDVKQLNAQARTDAEQALKLAPHASASQIALGYSDYYGRGDYAGALKSFATALALKPNDSDALAAQGYVQRRQGRFDDAIASLQKAFGLDPRDSSLAYELGATCMMVSDYREAQGWFQRALAIDPDNLNAKFIGSNSVLFSTGDVARALAAAQGDAPMLKLARVTLLTYERKYADALALLEGVPDTPDNFSGTNGPKTLQLAALYLLMGKPTKAKPLFEKAQPVVRAQIAMDQGINQAFDWQNLASVQLGLGHTQEALDATTKALAITQKSGDAFYAPQVMQAAAALYARIGRAGPAVSLLAKVLASPGIGAVYAPVLLWLDPAWDPIRRDTRFQTLLKKYAKYKPAVIYPIPLAASH